jgi:hypothetical protein
MPASSMPKVVNITIVGPPRAGKTTLTAALYNRYQQQAPDVQGRIRRVWSKMTLDHVLPEPTPIKKAAAAAGRGQNLQPIVPANQQADGLNEVENNESEKFTYHPLPNDPDLPPDLQFAIKPLPGELLFGSDQDDALAARNQDNAAEIIKTHNTDILGVVINPYLCKQEMTTSCLLQVCLFLHREKGNDFYTALKKACRMVLRWPLEEFETKLTQAAGLDNAFMESVFMENRSSQSLRKVIFERDGSGEFSIKNYPGPRPGESDPAGSSQRLLGAIRHAAEAVSLRYQESMGLIKALIQKHFPRVELIFVDLDFESIIHCATPAMVDALVEEFFQNLDYRPYHVLKCGNLELFVPPQGDIDTAATAKDAIRVWDLETAHAERFTDHLLKIIKQEGLVDTVEVSREVNWSRTLAALALLLPVAILLAWIVGSAQTDWLLFALPLLAGAAVCSSLLLSDEIGQVLEPLPRKVLYAAIVLGVMGTLMLVIKTARDAIAATRDRVVQSLEEAKNGVVQSLEETKNGVVQSLANSNDSAIQGLKAIVGESREVAASQAVSDAIAKTPVDAWEALLTSILGDSRVQQYELSERDHAKLYRELRGKWRHVELARRRFEAGQEAVVAKRDALRKAVEAVEANKVITDDEAKADWNGVKTRLQGSEAAASGLKFNSNELDTACAEIKRLLPQHAIAVQARQVNDARTECEDLLRTKAQAEEQVKKKLDEVRALAAVEGASTMT